MLNSTETLNLLQLIGSDGRFVVPVGGMIVAAAQVGEPKPVTTTKSKSNASTESSSSAGFPIIVVIAAAVGALLLLVVVVVVVKRRKGGDKRAGGNPAFRQSAEFVNPLYGTHALANPRSSAGDITKFNPVFDSDMDTYAETPGQDAPYASAKDPGMPAPGEETCDHLGFGEEEP